MTIWKYIAVNSTFAIDQADEEPGGASRSYGNNRSGFLPVYSTTPKERFICLPELVCRANRWTGKFELLSSNTQSDQEDLSV